MTLKFYIGAASEIDARFAGAPSASTTTVSAVASNTVFTVANAAWITPGMSVVVHQQKGVVLSKAGNQITLTDALGLLPSLGDKVFAYDADMTSYRDASKPFAYTDDLKTGGDTGSTFGAGQDIILMDKDGEMPEPKVGNRVSIFDSVDPSTILFGGVITKIDRELIGPPKTGSIRLAYKYTLKARGYQFEADSVGIEEQPFINVNAGEFLNYLRQKYTTLDIGSIDTLNSPRIDYIRLGNFRRFSDVGRQLAAMWPNSEFFIDNGQSNGKVYFRQKTRTQTPFTLDESFLKTKGPLNVKLTTDLESTFNIVLFPFFAKQRREPDFFVQSTVTDNAFLKTSVQLNGIPTSVEESVLLYDDFLDGALDANFIEEDKSNPSPPSGYTSADGFIIEGVINQVEGLQLLNGTIAWGECGRATDPAKSQPWSGTERQMIYLREMVVNALGDEVVAGIMDQSTVLMTVATGATTTQIPVNDASLVQQDDRITIGTDTRSVSSVSGSVITVSAAFPVAPAFGTSVQLHAMSKSRVKYGISFKASGAIKILKNGVETDPSRGVSTYTAPTTYSLRTQARCFESTLTSGISLSGATLVDASNFAVGDVIDIYTAGSRVAPETRIVLTKVGNAITYDSTNNLPNVGYRIRTRPKLVTEIKGGAYSSITGRTWVLLHQETNTYQTSLNDPLKRGVLLCLHKSMVATLTLFKVSDPPAITANIGSRYLNMGTQETDSAEVDTDCIIRKVGAHYQLDFFPDTKTLWGSGQTLELRFDEKFEFHLTEADTDSMKQIARQRGFNVNDSTDYNTLVRLGGRVLDTIELSPTPLSFGDATNFVKNVLDAVKTLAVTVRISSNTYADRLISAGMIIPVNLPEMSDLEIKQVQVTEYPGSKNDGSQFALDTGKTLYKQEIIAGSVDRLSEILLKRQIKATARLVIDDGERDDTYSRIVKYVLSEKATSVDTFAIRQCSSPTNVLYTLGGGYTLLECLRIA